MGVMLAYIIKRIIIITLLPSLLSPSLTEPHWQTQTDETWVTDDEEKARRKNLRLF